LPTSGRKNRQNVENYADANGTGIVKTAQTGRFQAKKKPAMQLSTAGKV